LTRCTRSSSGTRSGAPNSRSLGTISRELNQRADAWGESRDPPLGIGFVGDLAILFRVDDEDRVAEVAEVRLRHRGRPG
jgi:hypothetical protein